MGTKHASTQERAARGTLQTSVTLKGEEAQMIAEEALRTHTSASRLLRDYALEYIRIRKDVQRIADLEGADFKTVGGYIESVLMRHENRMVSTMDRFYIEIQQMRTLQEIMLAFMDTYLMTYLAHTPEITDEKLKEMSAVSASSRYQKFMNAMPSRMGEDGVSVVRKAFIEDIS
jgi:hypothetical protein